MSWKIIINKRQYPLQYYKNNKRNGLIFVTEITLWLPCRSCTIPFSLTVVHKVKALDGHFFIELQETYESWQRAR